MKVLCIADIHIGEYPTGNYKPNFRREQFMKLADRLVEMRTETGADEIWILGDFLKVPNSSNRINHVLFKFVKKLCQNYKVVRYILGNHDFSQKTQTQDLDDTIISLIRDEDEDSSCSNFEYMDHTTIMLGGHSFAFMNWTPNQDWTWADADCYLGHLTHPRPGSSYQGQKIKGKEPKLFLFGDIHASYLDRTDTCDYVSIGTPLQGNMGDQVEGKALLLDTETLEWKHVDIDPDHTRFLRMIYTPVKEDAGFYDDGLTYKVFKPVIRKSVASENKKGVLEFDDVDELINQVIVQEGLVDTHSEVLLSNPEYNSINFDFHLISLDIHGYRSIRDMHIDFDADQKDVMVLVGQNGSGKSSVIRALQACFTKNRYMQSEKSDLPGCSEFSVNVKFMYDNKLYEINKGDKSNVYYAIDGKVRKCNLTELESEIERELPFVKYLDLLFINADSPNLADKFSDSRRIQLIKRFYRLDRLSAFKEVASKKYKDESELILKDEKEVEKTRGIIETKNTELNELHDIFTEVEKYDSLVDEYNDLQVKKAAMDEYKEYKKKLDDLELDKKLIHEKIDLVKGDTELDTNELKSILANTDAKLEELINQQSSLTKRRKRRNELAAELKVVTDEGKKIAEKIMSIEEAVCPECGQKLKDDEKDAMLHEYKQKRQVLLNRWNELNAELRSIDVTDLDAEEKELYKLINDAQAVRSEQNTKLQSAQKASEKLTKLNTELNDLVVKINELMLNPVSAMEFSSESIDRMIELKDVIGKCDRVMKLRSDISMLEDSYNYMTASVNERKAELNSLVKYIDAMSDTGIIMKSILEALADSFNEECTDITYEVSSGIYRGKPYLTFDQYLDVKGNKREYSTLSSGQKTFTDLDFLSRLLVNKVGLIVLDEFLKFNDDDSMQYLQKKIRDLNANTIIISTHDNNYVDYTRRMYLSLDSTGATVVEE